MVCWPLRLNFLGSKKRCKWLQADMPDVYVLPNRPDFTGDGGDATEYAWFVWYSEEYYCKYDLRRHDSKVGQIIVLNVVEELPEPAWERRDTVWCEEVDTLAPEEPGK